MIDPADVTSLLASRICHDLVSPVGAIVNGTDLIAEIGVGDVQDEIAMIRQSAGRASALLQYYRIAFGAADDDSMLARGTLQTQAGMMLETQKIALDWEGLDGPSLSRSEGRFLFQLLMCARAVAGMRGRIAVRLNPTAGLPISITVIALGTGPAGGSINQDALRLMTAEPAPGEISARQVEFALIHRSAAGLGVRLDVAAQGDGARIDAIPA